MGSYINLRETKGQSRKLGFQLMKRYHPETLITSPARSGVKIKSEGKPLSRACCATGEAITFFPRFLPEGGCVTIAAT